MVSPLPHAQTQREGTEPYDNFCNNIDHKSSIYRNACIQILRRSLLHVIAFAEAVVFLHTTASACRLGRSREADILWRSSFGKAYIPLPVLLATEKTPESSG
jgi:hypothetical protein